HRTLDLRTRREAARDLVPRVLGELLDAERDALVVDVDPEDHGLDVVALLVELARVLHLLRPVQVRHVDEAVDVVLDLDEEPEVGDALDLPRDARPDGVVDPHHLPRVRLGLLQAERDAPVGRVDVDDLDLDLLARLEHLRRVGHALRPRHLGDVDQPLEAALDLDERAVVGEAHDLALDPGADRHPLRHGRPRVRHDLLHAERDALALRVVLEDDHLDAVADVQDLGGMPDAPPRHVGHVEEPVDAAEVHEGPVVGDVLDGAFEDDAFLEDLQRLRLERRALPLEDRAPRDDDVPARAVELEDREAAPLAEVAIEVPRRPQVGMRAGEERGDADVDAQPALHLADDRALDGALALVGLLDLAPDLELLRLLPREADVARLGVARLEVDVDVVAFLHVDGAVARRELGDRDLAFRFVADVDRDVVAADVHDAARDDVAGLRALQALFEEGPEVLLGADLPI